MATRANHAYPYFGEHYAEIKLCSNKYLMQFINKGWQVLGKRKYFYRDKEKINLILYRK